MTEVAVNEGDWVLFRAYDYRPIEVRVERAAKVSPKLIKFDRQFHPRQCNRLSVVAAFPDKETAERVRDAIAGVSDEYERRCSAAEQERSRRITEAMEAAKKQVATIVAKAHGGQS